MPGSRGAASNWSSGDLGREFRSGLRAQSEADSGALVFDGDDGDGEAFGAELAAVGSDGDRAGRTFEDVVGDAEQ